jgi:5-methylcytosine-specific restriction endonuclease McrA
MNKPTYSDSKGNRYTTAQINRKSDAAARLLLEIQFINDGFNYCTRCKRNDCKPIDVSHTISRKQAKENGCVEQIWNLDNLEILGRRCHKIKDKLI